MWAEIEKEVTVNLVIDAAVQAYIDVTTDLDFTGASPAFGQALKDQYGRIARYVAVSMLEALLDVDDVPAGEQFDHRLAEVTARTP